MVESLSKFQGCDIKIDSQFDSLCQINDFLQYLTFCCSLSDVILSYRFLCVELTSTSVSLYTLFCCVASVCLAAQVRSSEVKKTVN